VVLLFNVKKRTTNDTNDTNEIKELLFVSFVFFVVPFPGGRVGVLFHFFSPECVRSCDTSVPEKNDLPFLIGRGGRHLNVK